MTGKSLASLSKEDFKETFRDDLGKMTLAMYNALQEVKSSGNKGKKIPSQIPTNSKILFPNIPHMIFLSPQCTSSGFLNL